MLVNGKPKDKDERSLKKSLLQWDETFSTHQNLAVGGRGGASTAQSYLFFNQDIKKELSFNFVFPGYDINPLYEGSSTIPLWTAMVKLIWFLDQ